MNTCFKIIGVVGLIATTALSTAELQASSHREAPGITRSPKVDSTDFYMFRSYESGREDYVTIIANYVPLQDPQGGPNYFTMDEDAIYEIHIDNDGDANEDITFQFDFETTLVNGTGVTLNIDGVTNPIALRNVGSISAGDNSNLGDTETYELTMVTGDRRTGARQSIATTSGVSTFTKPFDNIGGKTFSDYASYANQYIYDITIPGCNAAGKVFVGQRDEPFVVNLGKVFDLVNLVPIEGDSSAGAGDGGGFSGGITQSTSNDVLAGKNITSVALEVPIACLVGNGNGVIGGWMTSSLPQARLLDPTPTYEDPDQNGGAYTQVSRLGMPLVNEVVIGLPDKDLFNASEPSGDGQFASYVTNPTFPAILDVLFNSAVNATLGTSIANLAPSNFPRGDLVAAFLTGIAGVNQMSTVTASEMLRLNTGIAATARASQSTLGIPGDDLAGFPNGRRPGDDVVDLTLRVAMGALCLPVPVNGTATDLNLCGADAAAGAAAAPTGGVAFTDGAPLSALDFDDAFPYVTTPLAGSN